MLALVLEEDPVSRKTLGEMVFRTGFQGVLEARGLEEAIYLARHEATRIRLVLSNYHWAAEPHTPFSHFITETRELDLAAWILMYAEMPFLKILRRSEAPTRVDGKITKPFGAKTLLHAIEDAQAHRASLRNWILLVGERYYPEVVQATWSQPRAGAGRNRTHWLQVALARNVQEMESQIAQLGARIGCILLDPEKCQVSASDLARFKRTPLGQLTPVATLSRTPEVIRPFHQVSELYFDLRPTRNLRVEDWTLLLERLSLRVVSAWSTHQLLLRARSELKSGNLAETRSLIKRGLRLDPFRWELHEAMGDALSLTNSTEQSIHHYQQALKINPCTPRSYLGLLRISRGSDLWEAASAYCPAHPQLHELMKSPPPETTG